MDIFGRSDSSIRQIKSSEQAQAWRPETEIEQEAFSLLTSKENRVELKKWYLQISTINPLAEMFRQILERAINEKLPLGSGD
jgi:hypothetical protein